MARPLGAISTAVLQALADGPMTARDLVRHLRVPERTIKDVCHRLVAGEHAYVLDRQRVMYAKRPVARYALPVETVSYEQLNSCFWR